MFQIRSDKYKTLKVSNNEDYNPITYTYAKDHSGMMGLVEKAGVSLHSQGLHFGKSCIEIYTPEQNAIAYGTTTYQQLLEQYIEMTDDDGEGDNFYTPENFEFVNGSVSNYWE
jgi:hypothetical protein